MGVRLGMVMTMAMGMAMCMGAVMRMIRAKGRCAAMDESMGGRPPISFGRR